MVNRTKLVTGAAALVSAGSLAFAGATLASADTTSAQNSGTTNASSPSTDGQNGQGDQSRQDGPNREGGQGARGGHEHTEVTGAAATKVGDAVKAKDSGITVESVRKDPDGSYDVMGTKDGKRVMVEVSADLKTVEVRQGGPGDHGGPGGARMNLTEVTGADATKVGNAVKVKDAGFTVQEVRKDAEGRFHVRGTKGGQPAMAHVSADLKTVEVRQGGPGGHGGPGEHHGGPRGDQDGQEQSQGQQGGARQAPSAPNTTPSTGTAPTDVPSRAA